MDVSLAREACRRIGYEPVFRLIDWDQKDEFLQNGEVDCLWGCFSMNNREEIYLWAGPYACSRQVVAVRQDSDIQSLGDLAGHRVAVQIRSKPEEIFSAGTDPRLPTVSNIYCLLRMEDVVSALRKGYVAACAGHAAALTAQLDLPQELEAPVQLGQTVGTVRILSRETQLGEYEVRAAADAEKMDFGTAFGLLWDALTGCES